MKSYLKVKVCTLAAESKCIKLQMRKWKKRAASARARDRAGMNEPAIASQRIAVAEANYDGLRSHRVSKEGVQKELRDSNLAYGFLRNRPYHVMEAFAYTKPNWSNIEKMVGKFGGDGVQDVMQRFSEWKHDAEAYALAAADIHQRAAENKVQRPHLPGTQRPAAPHVG